MGSEAAAKSTGVMDDGESMSSVAISQDPHIADGHSPSSSARSSATTARVWLLWTSSVNIVDDSEAVIRFQKISSIVARNRLSA